MITYQLGSKVKGIIRSYTTDPIGDQEIEYVNQPYTIFDGARATVSFRDVEKTQRSGWNDAYYNASKPYEVKIYDVLITNKILNLIFKKNEDNLCTVAENCESDGAGQIFLNTAADEVYQVFIYNSDGELESAYGTSGTTLHVSQSDANYLVVYSFLNGKSYNLDSLANMYLKLDLIIEGNKDDNTSTTYLHFDKCGIRVDKQLSFNTTINAVDYGEENNNFITFEE